MSENPDVFLDANMIMYMNDFELEDVALWLGQLYNKIYVHIEIIEKELLLAKCKNYCNEKINTGDWLLFNPKDEKLLNEEQFEIYTDLLAEVRIDFKRYQETREDKKSSDMGDIAILAGCRTLSVGLISSNDSDFKKVIQSNLYLVNLFSLEEVEDTLIEVQNLVSFSVQCITKKIAKRKQVKKFINGSIPDHSIKIMKEIDQILDAQNLFNEFN